MKKAYKIIIKNNKIKLEYLKLKNTYLDLGELKNNNFGSYWAQIDTFKLLNKELQTFIIKELKNNYTHIDQVYYKIGFYNEIIDFKNGSDTGINK